MGNCMNYFMSNYKKASKKQKNYILALLDKSYNFTLQDGINLNTISMDQAGLIIDTLLENYKYDKYAAKYLKRNY